MRVVIAEDAAMMREGLVRLLTDRGFEVAAAVADADALRSAIAEVTPDVAIVDIRMPPTYTDEGLRAAVDIRRDHPGQRLDQGGLACAVFADQRMYLARPQREGDILQRPHAAVCLGDPLDLQQCLFIFFF